MDTETRKISVNAMEHAIKDEVLYTEHEFYGEVMIVKRKLSLSDMLTFVSVVADGVFTDDGDYMPEGGDFAERCALLEIYANFRLPTNIEKKYNMVYSDVMSEAVHIIMESIDENQYEAMMNAVYSRRNYRIRTDVRTAEKKVDELVKTLDDLGAQINDIFGGMTEDEMKGIFSSLAKGVDEGKIMDAYIAAKEKDAADVKAEE